MLEFKPLTPAPPIEFLEFQRAAMAQAIRAMNLPAPLIRDADSMNYSAAYLHELAHRRSECRSLAIINRGRSC